jgi:putative ABC transport system permease protein
MLALLIAATVTTALLILYSDAQSKVQQQFRAFGANVTLSTPDGSALPPGALAATEREVGADGQVVPYAYAIAETSDAAVLVAGTDFVAARKLNSWWSVTAWPQSPASALVGKRAAQALRLSDSFDLTFKGKPLHLSTAGVLTTGGNEDNRIFVDLPTFIAWSRIQPSTLEIYVAGSKQQINSAIAHLTAEFPQLRVAPVAAITEAEYSVLSKAHSTLLAAALLIAVTSLICLLATMTAASLQRRRDFALMKALGASQTVSTLMFASEAALLGFVGGLLGFFAGVGVAELISRVNFNSATAPHFALLPIVLFGTIVLSILMAAAPLTFLRRSEPAAILKGE